MSGDDRARLLGASAVMAAGTAFSRLSGYLRTTLLAAALGVTLHADLFNIANTIPNMLYILLAGGVFNAVLVPQLVRSMKHDTDGGDAFANRVVTVAALFLGAVTVLLVVTAPWLMDLFLAPAYRDGRLAAQHESIVNLARYCLPQVFFYGMYVLVGQILNARGSFGPMMWAPIANNLIAIGVLVGYLFVYGPARGAELCGAYSTGRELLLGLGSTAGIAVQFIILVPFLRRAGFSYRPRFDFRNSGLGHTLRLGSWTVAFVVVNQIAYTVVVRLASGGTAQGALDCGVGPAAGTGYSIYSAAFLIVMVPHAIVTVSLATAALPRLSARAADGDLRGLAEVLGSTLRTSLAVVIPFAVLLPVITPDVALLTMGYGAARSDYRLAFASLSLFGIGLLLFTVHYFMLRGFYALEQTRTVFWIQCWVAGTNVVAAVVLVGHTDPIHTAPALVLAYCAAYLVGSVISFAVLRRALGGLDTPRLAGFALRVLAAAALATLLAAAVRWGWDRAFGPAPGHLEAAIRLALVGALDLLAFAWLATRLQVVEVTEVLDLIDSRLPRPLRRGGRLR